MKVYSQLKIPTLLAASLSCLMLAGCGTDDKPSIPSSTQQDNGNNNNNGGDNNNGGGKDDTKKDKDITFFGLNGSPGVTLYEDGTETDCSTFNNSGKKCGAINFDVSISELTSVLDKLTKEKPATVKYTLTSKQGNVADILKDPSQVTGVVKLYHDEYATPKNNPGAPKIVIPLKTDEKHTGDWTITLTLSEPHNPLGGKASIGPLHSATYTVIDPDSATPKVMAKVNDTGVTFTGNNLKGNKTLEDCTNAKSSKQDCNVGRDAMYNDNSNGWAGFDFTKLDKDGKDLKADATDWSCVRDNVTGKVWERKTYAPQIEGKYGAEANANKDYRDAKWDYAYYDSKTGLGIDKYNPNGGGGTDCKLGKDVKCNTENYIARVNKDKLCGISNWRVPNRNELFDIVNLSSKEYQKSMHGDWFFSSNKKIPLEFWSSSVAPKYGYNNGYSSPKTLEFNYMWAMFATGQFNIKKPTDYSGAAILAVSDPQQ